eukprot:gene24517-10507_t
MELANFLKYVVSLNELRIFGTQLGNAGMKALLQGIQHCSTLHTVMLQ